jgi:TolB-like protein/Tfp pilus assembly protein PilF
MPDESIPQAQPSSPPTATHPPPSTHGLPGHHHTHPQLPRFNFIEEFKRRNVGRVAILYIVLSYLVLEIFGVFVHLLELPAWMGRSVVLLVAIGFPIALLFAWIYEITPEGLKPSSSVAAHESITGHTAQRLNRAIIAVLAIALTYFVLDKFWLSKHAESVVPAVPAATAADRATAPPTAAATFSPPPHSIAVLPFVNESSDKNQEYFSDGLSEELLNALARVKDLRVAARTSAFSFKGTSTNIKTIARELNVGAILEGSVRRAGNAIRVTAQLSDAVSGYQLWSHEYDKSLTDVFKVQAAIADEVTSALKVTLLQGNQAALELGGTRNPEALDAYLQALPKLQDTSNVPNLKAAAAGLSRAIDLDPDFALAHAQRSLALDWLGNNEATTISERLASAESAKADALRAIALAPQLPEGHAMLASILQDGWMDFSGARAEYEKAIALGPSNTTVIRFYSGLLDDLGEHNTSLSLAHQLIALDPLNFQSYRRLGNALLYARRYREAMAMFERSLSLKPDQHVTYVNLANMYVLTGQPDKVEAACKAAADNWECRAYLAIADHQLGRQDAADQVLDGLAKEAGETGAAQYSEIYAQFGDRAKALDWLEKAWALRDAGLQSLKVDPLMDPIRSEPRFQAVLKALKFPD